MATYTDRLREFAWGGSRRKGLFIAAAAVAGCGSPATAPPSAETVTQAAQALDDCGDATHPVRLACTGLYSDPAAQIIAGGVLRYDPGLALWSDAAEKNRY